MHALSRLKVHFPHLQELFNGVATSQELHRSFKVKTNGKRQYSFHDFHCHCHFFYSLPYSQWFAPRGLSKKASPTITASSQTSPSNSPTKELPTINVSGDVYRLRRHGHHRANKFILHHFSLH